MRAWVRNIGIGIIAILLAGFCTSAMPLLDLLLHHGGKKSAALRVVASVSLKSMETRRPDTKPERALRKPARARPLQTTLRSGPRYAMDLGVAGTGGALAPVDIVNRKSGGSGRSTGEDQGVDERPAPAYPPPFRMPAEVKSRELDGYLMLSFCVDVSGRPYDIRVSEEKPSGLGMAAAGREALSQTRFSPARKDGMAVPFCGLEQPFEIRFSN